MEAEEVTLRQLVEKEVAKKKIKKATIHKHMKVPAQNLQTMLRPRGNITIKKLSEILHGMDEEIVLAMKDGTQYRLVM